ncbi:hypothetical protein Acr_16g0001590 [Actinidia rufa]|uniref:Uncharacterized protein n=1 Tax=Actinidia rufa TaxID=165716 RepID=A0A7J0FXX7_9ERIC|nr:hypothetical protein Acr_16g0001590 [Actinidia rufa]
MGNAALIDGGDFRISGSENTYRDEVAVQVWQRERRVTGGGGGYLAVGGLWADQDPLESTVEEELFIKVPGSAYSGAGNDVRSKSMNRPPTLETVVNQQ